jgi:hypothetical protein
VSTPVAAVKSCPTIHQGQRAHQASTPAAPPQIVLSHRKQADKPKIMPSSSFHAGLPHVVLSWVDENQNERIHVDIAMPPGMQLLKKTEITSTDSGPCFNVIWQWPQIMLDPTKVFAHSRFKGTIQASHPKVIAFVTETDKIRAEVDKKTSDGVCTSEMIVNLPPGAEYQYAPEIISGHPAVNVFAHHTDNTVNTHTTTFCLFDSMVKISDDGKRFSTKANLLDDNKCD